jgi:hypothetical protein
MVVYSGAFCLLEERFAKLGEARTASRDTGTAFRAHKSLVKTVNNSIPVPRFPHDFPLPIPVPKFRNTDKYNTVPR